MDDYETEHGSVTSCIVTGTITIDQSDCGLTLWWALRVRRLGSLHDRIASPTKSVYE